MTALPLVTHSSNVLQAGGLLQIARRNAVTGLPGPYRDLGNVPSVTLSRAVDQSEVLESRSGTFQLLKKFTNKTTYAVKAVLMNMTVENFALALGADKETVTPSTTPITGEELREPIAGGIYHLGDADNPEGVGIISAFTSLAIKATARTNSMALAVGDVISASSVAYVCTVAGTAGGSPPTYPTAGATASDGTATIKHLGPVACAGAGVDYSSSLDPAVVQIIPGTTDLTTSIGRMPSGYTLTLIAAYTPAGTAYERVIPLSAEAEYKVRFDGQSASGTPIKFVGEYCKISSSGDSEFINPTSPQVLNLDITPLKRETSKDPIIPFSKAVDEWINA